MEVGAASCDRTATAFICGLSIYAPVPWMQTRGYFGNRRRSYLLHVLYRCKCQFIPQRTGRKHRWVTVYLLTSPLPLRTAAAARFVEKLSNLFILVSKTVFQKPSRFDVRGHEFVVQTPPYSTPIACDRPVHIRRQTAPATHTSLISSISSRVCTPCSPARAAILSLRRRRRSAHTV